MCLCLGALSFEGSDHAHTLKVLGLQWHPTTDSFHISLRPLQERCTKRYLLSHVARIFDPLGFLTHLAQSFKAVLVSVLLPKVILILC